MGEVEGRRKRRRGETATGNNDTYEVDGSIKLLTEQYLTKHNINHHYYYYCYYQ